MISRTASAGLATFALMLFAGTPSALAFLPIFVPDYRIAQRAELVVVGHIKPGSVEYLPYEEKRGAITATNFVPSARLIVTEVADGPLRDKEITLWFIGGTLPLVGGKFEWKYAANRVQRFQIYENGKDYPAESIQIGTLNNGFYSRHDLKDLRDDHLWLLRRQGELPGLSPGQKQWAIPAWEYVEQALRKDYFMAYRAANPRQALLAQLDKHRDRADEIRAYLAYLDAVDYSRIADPQQRARKLVPFLASNGPCLPKPAEVAREALLATGNPAGKVLVEELPKSKDVIVQRQIICLLGEMKYVPAVETLVRRLQADNELWSQQKTRAFDPADRSDANRTLRESFEEIRVLVKALGNLGDVRSRPVLEATRQRWTYLGYGIITAACEWAIYQIDAATPNSDTWQECVVLACAAPAAGPVLLSLPAP